MGFLDIIFRWMCSCFSTASWNTMEYLLYLLLSYNIYSLSNCLMNMDFRLSDWQSTQKIGDFWRSWPAFCFIAGVASTTGQLTLEAGKCAQSDESLIPSFHNIKIEMVYGQVFVFLIYSMLTLLAAYHLSCVVCIA